MPTQNEILNSDIGARISGLRKLKGLSQSDLGARLSRPRTQAWVSNVESGRRQVNHGDLFEITSILDSTLSSFFDFLAPSAGSPSKSFTDTLEELVIRLPIEMPVYLQSELSKTDPVPIDYQYSSAVPGRAIFSDGHPSARSGAMKVMVVERHYHNPKMDPTDLLTFSNTGIPVPDPDDRVADRIVVSLNEPLDGLTVHPGICPAPGQVKISISGQTPIIYSGDEYKILGVVSVRRTLYRTSIIRTWIQRHYGIVKDERLIERRSSP